MSPLPSPSSRASQFCRPVGNKLWLSMFRPKSFRNFDYGTFRKHPTWFGIPFVLLIVAASFGLENLTRTRYEVHAQKVSEVSEEDRLKLQKNRKKIDLREEYFRLQAKGNEDWDSVRIPRPKGVPEWGVPPTEPSNSKK